MSLRLALRTPIAAYRSFSTISPCLNAKETTRQRGDSNQAWGQSSTASFDDLSSILAPFTQQQSSPAPIPSPFQASAPASPGSPTIPASGPSRTAYPPTALPPKVDPILDLFTNMLMRHGEKNVAQTKMFQILELIRKTSNQPPVPLVHRAILLTSPSVKVLNMRKSMKTIQTPRALSERQRTRQAIAWILRVAGRGRRASTRREERIAKEILAILEGDSEVFKFLELRHKEAALARSSVYAR